MNLTFQINKAELAFYLIFILTAMNGLFNSLCIAYGYDIWPMNTFLFVSSDLNADLVKFVLSFFQGQFPNYHEWAPLYQGYYIHNPYGGYESLKNGGLSSYGSFPAYILLCLGLGNLIYIGGPELLVEFFYVFIVFSSLSLIYFFSKKKNFSIIYITLTMLLSYPMLFLLTRGHIFSFITSSLAILFIYFVLKKRSIIIPILLLAIVVNFRPNMLILGTLFFLYGFKESIKAFILLSIVSLLIFGISLLVATNLLDGYSFSNILISLKTYSSMYIIGSGGDAFNNSLFGALKVGAMGMKLSLSEDSLIFLNKLTSFSLFALLPIGLYLYHTKRLFQYDLAFIVVAVYILATPAFATYHMTILFAFLLFKLKDTDVVFDSRYINLILAVIVFVLSAKNYLFINNVSLEVILNPLVMLFSILYILVTAYHTSRLENE